MKKNKNEKKRQEGRDKIKHRPNRPSSVAGNTNKKKQAGKNQPKKKKRPPQSSPRQYRKVEKKKRVSRGRKAGSFFFSFLFYLYIVVIVLGSLFFVFNKNDDKSIMGYRIFGVRTNSMVPKDPQKQKGGLYAGDLIVVQAIDGNDAEVGDIITFRPNVDSKAFLTHRVKEKLDHLGDNKGVYYITQGDANLAEDVPVNATQVVGKKVLVLPKIGGVLNFIKENPLVSGVFLLSILGFITVLRFYILNH